MIEVADSEQNENDEESEEVEVEQIRQQMRGLGDGRSVESLSDAKMTSSTEHCEKQPVRLEAEEEQREEEEADVGEILKKPHDEVVDKELGEQLAAFSIEEGKTSGHVDVEAEREEEEDDEEVTFESLHTSPPTLDRHLRDRICILVAGKARPVIPPPTGRGAGSSASSTASTLTAPGTVPVAHNRPKDSNNNKNATLKRPDVLPSDIYW